MFKNEKLENTQLKTTIMRLSINNESLNINELLPLEQDLAVKFNNMDYQDLNINTIDIKKIPLLFTDEISKTVKDYNHYESVN